MFLAMGWRPSHRNIHDGLARPRARSLSHERGRSLPGKSVALFGVAYRCSVAPLTPKTWCRCVAALPSARPVDLRSAKSYLTTIVTRLCLIV
jgi:hypothetical protein